MRAGRYQDAWALSARALSQRDPATRDDPTLPYHRRWVWDGRAIDGRDVLVRCYHGLGDTIQFARFLPLLACRARSVTLEVPSRLERLLGTIRGDVTIVPFDVARPLPPSEVDVEITDLDFVLTTAPDTVSVPYLSAPKIDVPAGSIGICYAAGDWDAARSLPARSLAPLCRLAPCLSLVPEQTDIGVLNPEGCPFDMAATASLIASVGLVVTVDTMIAHLAGGLGRPVWLLLKAEPDWRWTPGARDSAWYPTMRLYHQPRAGDWSTPLAHLERDLARSISALESTTS